MVLEFDFTGSGSSKSFLEVVYFLLELDYLSLLFVENASIVKYSGSSLLVFYCVFDFSFQKALDFVLK
jgi:hypothetical protein